MLTSPAAQLEARANREHQRINTALHELAVVESTVRHSDLSADVKIRLLVAIGKEGALLRREQVRIEEFRQGAQVSRGRQWVTSGDTG